MKMFERERPSKVFRKDVSRILSPCNFLQAEILGPKAILNPQIRRRQVPDFAQAPATADSNRIRRVCLDQDCPIEAEVMCHRSQRQ